METAAIIIYLALCLLAGWIAAEKGHSGAGFCLLAFVLSPIIGLPAALLVGKAKPQEPGELRVDASGRLERVPTERKCPHCAEFIKIEARVCKHCGRDVAPAELPA